MAFPNDWQYRKKLTIDNTKVDSTLTDFPVLVKLDNTNFDFDNAEPDGSDIQFTSNDGTTLLKFERERHVSGDAEYWVKIPSISSSVDTDFFIYYGNSSALDGEDETNVWDSNFKAVYHMASGLTDSTINGDDLTNQGTTEIDGKIAKARDYILSDPDRIDIPADVTNLSVYSVEFLFKRSTLWNSSATTEEMFWQRRANDNSRIGMRLFGNGTILFFNKSNNFSFNSIQSSWNADQYYHIYLTSNGSSTTKIYVDGVLDNSIASGVGLDIVANSLCQFGSQFFSSSYISNFDGIIDEARFSSSEREQEWVKATYHSNVNTLLSFGDEVLLQYENLEITDSIIVTDTIIQETENLVISDSIIVEDTIVEESESLNITDSIIVTPTNTDAKFISKIISVNPLIFVTDTNPIEIIKVDTTDPENLTWIVQTVPGISSAKDFAINTTNDFFYIAGSEGQVVKVEIDDLSNQTTIDLSDPDDLLTIETNSNFGLTYAGTEHNIRELYLID